MEKRFFVEYSFLQNGGGERRRGAALKHRPEEGKNALWKAWRPSWRQMCPQTKDGKCRSLGQSIKKDQIWREEKKGE